MSKLISRVGCKTLGFVVDSSGKKLSAIRVTNLASHGDLTFRPVVVTPSLFNQKRNFSTSQTLDKLKAWDKMKYKSRKPRHLGRAPTKLEVLDPTPTIDPAEQEIFDKWNKQYLVDMTHCYELMKEKSVMDSLDTGETQRAIQQERIHHANMMKENEKWNEEIAITREREFAERSAKEEAEIRATITSTLEAKAARHAEVMAYVDRLQGESINFITLDNIEEKVNEMLDTPVIDYNFSVDRNGKIHRLPKDPALLG